MAMKKKSIFMKILSPFLIIMMIQALLFYGTITVSGIADFLKDNSLRILNQNIVNHKNTLENEMVQRWSKLDECVYSVDTSMDILLSKEGATLTELLSDEALTNAFLQEISKNLLYTLRRNSVSGIFIILNQDGLSAYPEEEKLYPGVYYRDLDTGANPMDYSDILLVKGPSEVSSELEIRMDNLWTPKFEYMPNSEAYDAAHLPYYFHPLLEAFAHPELKYENLGYWSSPFYLNGNNPLEAEKIITYSIPLLDEQGEPFGVLGVEISESLLSTILQPQELDLYGRGGYLLVSYPKTQEEEKKECQVELVFGNGAKQAAHSQDMLSLEWNGRYRPLYELSDVQFYQEKAYGYLYELELYNTNTPFADKQWALLGISNYDALFGTANTMERRILYATGISLLIGVLSIYLLSRHMAKPIGHLMEELKRSTPDQVIMLSPSNMLEIDELSNVIHELSLKQKEFEMALERERERYLLALESTTDIIVEYDGIEDLFVLYQFEKENGASGISNKEYSHFYGLVKDGGITHPEDTKLLLGFLDGKQEEAVFRFNHAKKGETPRYEWFSAKGKAVFDENLSFVRIVGSMRNVTEMKEKELSEAEQNKRDKVTGLYKREVGEALIRERLQQYGQYDMGMLCIVDIDHFQSLNNQHGILYCDILLEEIAEILRRNTHEKDILLRLGGDEFLIYLEHTKKEDALEFTRGLDRQMGSLYAGNEQKMAVHFSGGLSEASREKPYAALFEEAMAALGYVKKHGKSFTMTYDDLPEPSNAYVQKIGQIASLFSEAEENVVSLAFTIFEKTNEVKNAIPVLLGKIGRHFHLERILVIDSDLDFYTNRVTFQWHSFGMEQLENKTVHFSKEEYLAFLESFSEEGFCSYMPDLQDTLSQKQKEFLKIAKGDGLFRCAMYDNGTFFGFIQFVYGMERGALTEEEQDSLKEIVKILAAHLSKSKADLASKAKSEFLSRMSHEIRTPMNAIMGMTNIALHVEKLPARAVDCLNKIDVSTKYLLSLINDILDMSRIESGKMNLEKGPFSLQGLVKELDALVRPQAELKNISLRFDIQAAEPRLLGDSLRLNQVMMNLLGNAIKFTPEQGGITVKMKQVSSMEGKASILFSVKDTGIGIEQENIHRIFHAFEQAEDNTARRFGGTGLGLAISSNLVRMMGGRLEVESAPGEGSDFHFVIQFEIDQECSKAEVQEDTPENGQWHFSGRRVLLVEDNDLNIEIAHDILEMAGFIIEEARNGREAVDLFAERPVFYYDVILMDIRMPVMDGLAATRAIRILPRPDARKVPIVAMTANAFDEDMKKSIESGMNGHLAKPFEVRRLYELLGQVLQKSVDKAQQEE